MEKKAKFVGLMVLMIGVMVFGMGLSYQAARKGHLAPGPEVSALGTPSMDPPAVNRFLIGELVAPTRDEELHYIKVEIELRYLGDLSRQLEERKYEIKELITQLLTRMNVQRAKEEFLDGFLQKDLERSLNRLLGTSTQADRIEKVTVATFLVH